MYISRKRKNAHTALTPDNSLPESDTPEILPPTPEMPEAQIELINGEGSDLGSAAPTANITYGEFLEKNSSTGSLRVQAFLGNQGLPVANAFVTVSAPFSDGEKVFYAVRTNADGVADNIVLPAPSRENTQIPGSDNPFAVYTVTVSHPSFRTAVFGGVPVFAGVKSIQPVAFLPQIKE